MFVFFFIFEVLAIIKIFIVFTIFYTVPAKMLFITAACWQPLSAEWNKIVEQLNLGKHVDCV